MKYTHQVKFLDFISFTEHRLKMTVLILKTCFRSLFFIKTTGTSCAVENTQPRAQDT